MSERFRNSALLTDLYELTMAAAYFENDLDSEATFELFIRDLPPRRGYLLLAGLEQALNFLETLHFSDEEIAWLRKHPVLAGIKDAFFDYLREFHFTGEVWAVPEGTPVFPAEPLVRVTAPIIEAQIAETYLLSVITFQTLIATKAARLVQAAQGRGVVEFGTRRAHGPEAGVLAGRAAYIGGCLGTSNVEAGFRYGIPTYGTLAHSFVMAYEKEEESFQQFHRVFPRHSVLLLDTYDTLAAVDKIISLGLRPPGVRLDSGDLVTLSKEVRRRLDAAGLRETKIFASGDLNEQLIGEILAQGAPIDHFGVGTALATSKDAPSLGGVYKLVEVIGEGRPRYRAKFSQAKATDPGRKQVFRFSDPGGQYEYDLVASDGETAEGGQPLLSRVLGDGRRTGPAPALSEVRESARQNLSYLPEPYRRLQDPATYLVRTSPGLRRLRKAVEEEILHANGKKIGERP